MIILVRFPHRDSTREDPEGCLTHLHKQPSFLIIMIILVRFDSTTEDPEDSLTHHDTPCSGHTSITFPENTRHWAIVGSMLIYSLIRWSGLTLSQHGSMSCVCWANHISAPFNIVLHKINWIWNVVKYSDEDVVYLILYLDILHNQVKHQ